MSVTVDVGESTIKLNSLRSQWMRPRRASRRLTFTQSSSTVAGSARQPSAPSWYSGSPGAKDMTTPWRFWSRGSGTRKAPSSWRQFRKSHSRFAARRLMLSQLPADDRPSR